MTLTVNGDARDVSSGATLEQLLEELGVKREGIAVAINERVVPGATFEGRELREGDVVEIIQAVAGG